VASLRELIDGYGIPLKVLYWHGSIPVRSTILSDEGETCTKKNANGDIQEGVKTFCEGCNDYEVDKGASTSE
jgi:hypothetical protein